jgi:eukaryotic-like serine/threonine-protein kinase
MRMNQDRWQRITELFDEAVESPLEEVESFLRRACGGDRRLERAVRTLIEASREAGDFLEDPLLGSSVRKISACALRARSKPNDD